MSDPQAQTLAQLKHKTAELLAQPCHADVIIDAYKQPLGLLGQPIAEVPEPK